MALRDEDWMADMNDHRARAFGHRPEGQEHQVLVDHAMLAAAEPGSHDWERILGYLGLVALKADDPALPPEIAALLRCTEDRYGALPFATAGIVALLAWAGCWLAGLVPAVTVVIFLIGAVGFTGVATTLLEDPIVALWRRLWGEPPWTKEWRKRRALAALEARPFVVLVDGLLVENVPVLSRLREWERSLREAGEEAERRLDRVDELREGIDRLRERLDERGVDQTRASLDRLRAREATLRGRIGRVLRDVTTRRAELEEGLGELRARTELERLRDEAQALAGAPESEDAPARVAADLEVDVSDLEHEVSGIRAEIHEAGARLKALGELSALGA